MNNNDNNSETPPDMPNPNNLTHWIIPSAYATRFVVDTYGRLIIEFAPGREQEIHDYLLQHLDFHNQQMKLRAKALIEERNRQVQIEAAKARKVAAMGNGLKVPAHQSVAPVQPLVEPQQYPPSEEQ
jgi:hypothetical protein